MTTTFDDEEESVKKDIQMFMEGFIKAVNSRSMEAMVDCLEPEVSERYLSVVKKREINSSEIALLYPYLQNALGLKGTVPYNFLAEYKITIDDIVLNQDSAQVIYKLSREYEGESAETVNTSIWLTRKDDEWFIPADKETLLGGNGQPPLITPNPATTEEVSGNLYTIYVNGKYGFMNGYGKEIVPPSSYDEMGDFSYGYCPVKLDQFGWGFVQCNGELAVYYSFDRVENVCIGGYWPVRNGPEWHFFNPETGDYSAFCCDDVCNSSMRPFEYTESDGEVFYVKSGELYGTYNPVNGRCIPCIYEEMYRFKEERSVVKKNGFWGVIDLEGKGITEFKYDSTSTYYVNGRLVVSINGGKGVIDASGKEVLAIKKNRDVELSISGLMLVSSEEGYGFKDLCDKNGNVIMTGIYGWNTSSSKNCVLVEGKMPDNSLYPHLSPSTPMNIYLVSQDGTILFNALEDLYQDMDLDEYDDKYKYLQPFHDYQESDIRNNRVVSAYTVNYSLGDYFQFYNIIDFSGNTLSDGWINCATKSARIIGDHYYLCYTDGEPMIKSFGGKLIDRGKEANRAVEMNGTVFLSNGRAIGADGVIDQELFVSSSEKFNIDLAMVAAHMSEEPEEKECRRRV